MAPAEDGTVVAPLDAEGSLLEACGDDVMDAWGDLGAPAQAAATTPSARSPTRPVRRARTGRLSRTSGGPDGRPRAVATRPS